MALIKYGGGVAAIAGKQGGAVHARNRAGTYIRNWAKPSNAPTPVQTTRRSNFGNLAALWRSFPDDKRGIWNGVAATLTWYNRLGDPFTPTGRMLFMRCGLNLTLCGLDPDVNIAHAGPPPEIAPEWGTNFIGSGTTLTNIFAVPLASTYAGNYIVQAAVPQFGQRVNQILMYRQIGIYDLTGGPDMAAGYIAVFGDSWAIDYTFRMRFRAVDEYGQSSPWVITECFTTT